MSKVKWVVAGIAAIAVLITGGTFVYINFIAEEAPPPLSLDDTGGSASPEPAATGDPSGTWKPTPESVVGYRVKEVLFGQSNTAAGRTSRVSGSMTLAGTTVSAVEVVVDMASVTSDQTRRDNQFRGRIMEVSQYPTATFRLTRPITLPTGAATVSVEATGDLTLHGVTKSVTFPLQGKRVGSTIQVAGSIPVKFADYNISDPGFPGTVSTEDHGVLEFLVVFAQG